MTERWAGLVIGFWILLSPWIFGFSNITIMKWGNVLSGLVLILMNARMLLGKEPVSVVEKLDDK